MEEIADSSGGSDIKNRGDNGHDKDESESLVKYIDQLVYYLSGYDLTKTDYILFRYTLKEAMLWHSVLLSKEESEIEFKLQIEFYKLDYIAGINGIKSELLKHHLKKSKTSGLKKNSDEDLEIEFGKYADWVREKESN